MKKKKAKAAAKIYGWLLTFFPRAMVGLPSRLQFSTKEKAYEYMEKQNLRHVVSLVPITKTVKKFFGQIKNPSLLVPAGRAALSAMFRKNRKNPAVHRPVKAMEIYGRLLRIEAQKGPGHVCDTACKKANHCYYHDFSKHARVFGMPDGSLRITDKT